MKVILNEEVSNLGSIGDVVTVRGGYARNFLLPRGLAILASASNERALKHHVGLLEKKKQKVLSEAKTFAGKLNNISLTISKPVGEDERIFGTVTNTEVAALLAEEGVTIDKKQIHIHDEIKKVGVYTADVKLHPEVTAKVKVWVVAQ
jgi:large subunit ribosomal protein L9